MDYELLDLPTVTDERGGLTYVEQSETIPFDIQRVYYLYDWTGTQRGEHAHKQLQQVLIAVNGTITVRLDDGNTTTTVRLETPTQGLYVAPGLWRELEADSSDAVCLALASMPYDEHDYIRNYEAFLEWCGK